MFEGVRLALESRSAQQGGKTIPKKSGEELSQSFQKGLDIVSTEWPRMERDRIKEGLRRVINGLAADVHALRIKMFLLKERKEYETRLAQTQADAEKRKEAFDADPEHGGKMMAMTLSIFEAVAPQSAIRLIDNLLSELEFFEAAGLNPQDLLNRLLGLCDTGPQ